MQDQFQLTRPAWGVTPCCRFCNSVHNISTHTPCVGRDKSYAWVIRYKKFQLTRPAWGVTQYPQHHGADVLISTHTPCVGRDNINLINVVTGTQFQLTRPAWGVTCLLRVSVLPVLFQLTRPAWGVTPNSSHPHMHCSISTHTPCVGRDGY